MLKGSPDLRLVLPTVPLHELGRYGLARKQRRGVIGRQAQRILPAGHEAAQLPKTVSEPEIGCCSYFQLACSIPAYSDDGGHLVVY
ncbi:MAG: hypothetical protein ACLQVY_20965 [Limisphaerales bacterium]